MTEAVCVVAVHCAASPPCPAGCRLAPTVPPPPAVKLCLFRSCTWQSGNIATAPAEVQEEMIARHLLREHEVELRALGRFAEEMELL